MRVMTTAVGDTVTMFRPAPSVGLGRRWHVIDRELHGFMLVAPCGFIQGEILCERVAADRDRLMTRDRAVHERRACRLCLEALRAA